jgi:hypothetical protein
MYKKIRKVFCLALTSGMVFSSTNVIVFAEEANENVVMVENGDEGDYDQVGVDDVEDNVLENFEPNPNENIIEDDVKDIEILGEEKEELIEGADEIAFESVEKNVLVAGEGVASEALLSDNGFNSEAWLYNESTNTLTLTNYEGKTTENVEGEKAQIYFDHDVNLVLVGTNTLSAISDYGIYCDGNLTISGTGSLIISDTSDAIYATKNIDIMNATINAINSNNADIIANWGNFIATNARISLNGSVYARNKHDISIIGGSIFTGGLLNATNVTAKDTDVTAGIECTEKIILNNTDIVANPGGTKRNITAGRLEMTGGKIKQVGIIKVSSFNINGSTITSDTTSDIIETVSASYGSEYNVDSYLINSTVNAEKATMEFNNYYKVSAYINDSMVDVNCLYLEFETTSTGTWIENEYVDRIIGLKIGYGSVVNVNTFDHAWDNRLIIDGGELNVNGNMYFSENIYTEILEVNAGRLYVNGNVNFYDSGIRNSDVIINGGEVEITGNVKSNIVTVTGGNTSIGNGVNATTFTFSEGTFESTGSSQAVIADTITISGNIKAGKTKDSAKTVSEYAGEKYLYVYRVITNTPIPTATPTATATATPTPIPTATPVPTVTLKKQKISMSDIKKRIDYKTCTIKATLLEGNRTGSFTYTSDNPKVATITKTGKVTFKGVGQAKITASISGTKTYQATSKTITLTVIPTPTVLTKLLNNHAGWMNIQWRKIGGVDGYQVQYATNAEMTDVKSASITKNNTCSYTRKDVKKGKTYYVRVRTYKVVDGVRYYSNWSGIKSVKISK